MDQFVCSLLLFRIFAISLANEKVTTDETVLTNDRPNERTAICLNELSKNQFYVLWCCWWWYSHSTCLAHVRFIECLCFDQANRPTIHYVHRFNLFLSFTFRTIEELHTICICYTLWKVMICKNDFTDSRYLVNYSYACCHRHKIRWIRRWVYRVSIAWCHRASE